MWVLKKVFFIFMRNAQLQAIETALKYLILFDIKKGEMKHKFKLKELIPLGFSV